jgi:predicted RNA binding protein YcfA (HicA-like mRNA interferase family)
MWYYQYRGVIRVPPVDKIIEKMKNQPRGIRLEEAEKVLAAYGYVLKRQKGSHRHYLSSTGDLITLKDPLKISYIIEILERIGEK